jgi:hypothetical protein
MFEFPTIQHCPYSHAPYAQVKVLLCADEAKRIFAKEWITLIDFGADHRDWFEKARNQE